MYSSNITFSLLTILDDLQSMNYSGKGKDKGKGKSNIRKHLKNHAYQNTVGNDPNGIGGSRNAISDNNTACVTTTDRNQLTTSTTMTLVNLPSSSLYLPQVE